jgi:hypothetical protein
MFPFCLAREIERQNSGGVEANWFFVLNLEKLGETGGDVEGSHVRRSGDSAQTYYCFICLSFFYVY